MVEVGELRLGHLEDGGDGAGDARRAGLASAAAFQADHLDALAAAGDEFGQRLCLGIDDGAGLGADALGEEGDRLGIQPIGLGEPAGGAGEAADLAGVDHGERQAGAGK